MTEDEWQARTDPEAMLDFVRSGFSDRKLRLFACGCCRQPSLWHYLEFPLSRAAVETAEAFADGGVGRAIWEAAARAAPPGYLTGGGTSTFIRWNKVRLSLRAQAESAARSTTAADAAEAARRTFGATINLVERPVQTALLADIFGNPFRPVVLDPSLLTPAVVNLAKTIYDERAFDRMPELADELEKAHCTYSDILDHCRSRGPHVRGCRVVDLVLGRL